MVKGLVMMDMITYRIKKKVWMAWEVMTDMRYHCTVCKNNNDNIVLQ